MIKRIIGNQCPYCGTQNDGLTHIGPVEAPPQPGDFSVCFTCARPALFSNALSLLRLTLEEQKEADENISVQRVIKAIKKSKGFEP